MQDLGKQHPTEVVNGVSAKILEAAVEGAPGKARMWIDAKYGMIMRLKLPEADGTSRVGFETTQLTIGKPTASVFAPACKAGPAMPTDEDKIVALTGGPASDFAYANHGSPTKGGCLVYFRVVRAGSMAPVTTGYEVFVGPGSERARADYRSAEGVQCRCAGSERRRDGSYFTAMFGAADYAAAGG